MGSIASASSAEGTAGWSSDIIAGWSSDGSSAASGSLPASDSAPASDSPPAASSGPEPTSDESEPAPCSCTSSPSTEGAEGRSSNLTAGCPSPDTGGDTGGWSSDTTPGTDSSTCLSSPAASSGSRVAASSGLEPTSHQGDSMAGSPPSPSSAEGRGRWFSGCTPSAERSTGSSSLSGCSGAGDFGAAAGAPYLTPLYMYSVLCIGAAAGADVPASRSPSAASSGLEPVSHQGDPTTSSSEVSPGPGAPLFPAPPLCVSTITGPAACSVESSPVRCSLSSVSLRSIAAPRRPFEELS